MNEYDQEINEYNQEMNSIDNKTHCLNVNFIKWKCNICNYINIVDNYNNKVIKIKNNNIYGLGRCNGICLLKNKIHIKDRYLK